MGVGVTVWVGVGVIAWVWKIVCGWDSLDCGLKLCTCFHSTMYRTWPEDLLAFRLD